MTSVVQWNWLICSDLMGTIIMDCMMGRMQHYFLPAIQAEECWSSVITFNGWCCISGSLPPPLPSQCPSLQLTWPPVSRHLSVFSGLFTLVSWFLPQHSSFPSSSSFCLDFLPCAVHHYPALTHPPPEYLSIALSLSDLLTSETLLRIEYGTPALH